MTVMRRAAWTVLSDAQLLAQCEVDTYRASGPGGQKRNKTSSAVRLRHLPSRMLVIAEESRSQHENKARALRRTRDRSDDARADASAHACNNRALALRDLEQRVGHRARLGDHQVVSGVDRPDPFAGSRARDGLTF